MFDESTWAARAASNAALAESQGRPAHGPVADRILFVTRGEPRSRVVAALLQVLTETICAATPTKEDAESLLAELAGVVRGNVSLYHGHDNLEEFGGDILEPPLGWPGSANCDGDPINLAGSGPVPIVPREG